MTIHYQDDAVTLHHGDARDVLPTLPDGSVDCVVTSPPYYGLRDYGTPTQIGLESSPAEYVETLRALFGEIWRVLAVDGTAWLNLGDSYSGKANGGPSFDRHRGHGHRAGVVAAQTNTTAFAPYKSLIGIPWRVAFALQDDGWTIRNAIVWHKRNAMPESVDDRLRCQYEHVFLLAKANRYYFNLDAIKVPSTGLLAGNTAQSRLDYGEGTGVAHTARRSGGNPGSTLDRVHPDANPGDVWTINTKPFPGAHFACMPPALAERCIAAGCKPGGTVLDPFSGSGTTGQAAARHGHRYVGIDDNAEYLDMSLRTRLRQPGLLGEAVGR